MNPEKQTPPSQEKVPDLPAIIVSTSLTLGVVALVYSLHAKHSREKIMIDDPLAVTACLLAKDYRKCVAGIIKRTLETP